MPGPSYVSSATYIYLLYVNQSAQHADISYLSTKTGMGRRSVWLGQVTYAQIQ